LIPLLDSFQISFLDLLMAFLATLLLGIGKSGIKGLGVIIVTLMALVFGGKASTGILMPMMITADIFAVIYEKTAPYDGSGCFTWSVVG